MERRRSQRNKLSQATLSCFLFRKHNGEGVSQRSVATNISHWSFPQKADEKQKAHLLSLQEVLVLAWDISASRYSHVPASRVLHPPS